VDDVALLRFGGHAPLPGTVQVVLQPPARPRGQAPQNADRALVLGDDVGRLRDADIPGARGRAPRPADHADARVRPTYRAYLASSSTACSRSFHARTSGARVIG